MQKIEEKDGQLIEKSNIICEQEEKHFEITGKNDNVEKELL
jgi:hypothetical protein